MSKRISKSIDNPVVCRLDVAQSFTAGVGGGGTQPFALQQAIKAYLIAGLGLVLLSVLPYVPAVHGEFLWDDHELYISNNPLLKNPAGWYRAWVTTDTADYLPLTYTLFWCEWQLFGDNPFGYHVVNIVLHSMCVLFLWRILVCLKLRGAWVAAAIFAVHPVNVEAVAWISQAKALLATLFGFASLLAFLNDRSNSSNKRYLLSLFFFALSLAAKPTFIAMPFILFVFDWWRGTSPLQLTARRSLPYFAIALIFGLVGLWFHEVKVIGDDIVRDQSILERTLTAGIAVWFYIFKAVLPVNLMFVYPRWEVPADSVWMWVPIGSLVLATGILAWIQRDWSYGLLAALFFFVFSMGPILGFLDVYYWKYSFVADHYQYQSLPAVIVPIVVLAAYLVDRVFLRKSEVIFCLSVALLGVLIGLSVRQASLFQTQERVWRDTLSRNESAMLAYNNLGLVLLEQHRFDEAKEVLILGVSACPTSSELLHNLGNVYLRISEDAPPKQSGYFIQKAIESFDQALKLPKTTHAGMVGEAELSAILARLLFSQQRDADAEKYLSIALDAAEKNVATLYNLAILFESSNAPERALEYYLQAIQHDSNHFDSRINLGVLYHQLQRPVEGREQLKVARQLVGNNVEGQFKLATAFAFLNYREAAVLECRGVLSAEPSHEGAFQMLTALLASEQ